MSGSGCHMGLKRWYCQGDYPGRQLYQGSHYDVALAGCGPCSLTHALISQHIDVTPFKVLDALNEQYPHHSWFIDGNGTVDGFLGSVARAKFGCDVRTLWPEPGAEKSYKGGRSADTPACSVGSDAASNVDRVFAQVLCAIRHGHAVILSSHGNVFHGPDGRPYSSLGHYVCLYAFDDAGRILVADSSNNSDEKGPLAGGANPYTVDEARKLVQVAVENPCRHEVVELWRK